jgi:hypothetical protein
MVTIAFCTRFSMLCEMLCEKNYSSTGVKITQAETELILPVQICSIGVWFFNSVKTGGT